MRLIKIILSVNIYVDLGDVKYPYFEDNILWLSKNIYILRYCDLYEWFPYVNVTEDEQKLYEKYFKLNNL